MKRWVDVAALGVSQIIGYGTLHYSFSVLAPSMAHDLGWTSEWVFGAMSIALLTSGLVAPWTGRWMDRHGAGRIMAFGSAAGASRVHRDRVRHHIRSRACCFPGRRDIGPVRCGLFPVGSTPA